MKNEIKSFPPLVDKNCRVLVLGTMPGPESLLRQEYYAFGHNAFWPIMFQLCGQTPTAEYRAKTKMLLDKHIALWDVLQSCARQGSQDGSIRGARPNDIPALLEKYPRIGAICFNGQGAHRFFMRFFKDRRSLPFYILPSTSPANARLSREQKYEAWKAVKDLTTLQSLRTVATI